ncbi:unnamed protein product [Trichogramma brassicae]|uniref:Uncharacterized protein n=1 Tax=Trichogramma brassicae TaxID=86971 RepID=A0A6H5J800_9HYME|nr:unnamed protein product [Trichogramma brassicae]
MSYSAAHPTLLYSTRDFVVTESENLSRMIISAAVVCFRRPKTRGVAVVTNSRNINWHDREEKEKSVRKRLSFTNPSLRGCNSENKGRSRQLQLVIFVLKNPILETISDCVFVSGTMADDDINDADTLPYDESYEFETGEEKSERLKRLRENVNWDIEDERRAFFHQFKDMTSVWWNGHPNLKDIFRREEIDWILSEFVKSDDGKPTGETLVDFVIRTGYRDEPELGADEDFEFWRSHENLVSKAKELMVIPSLSLYDLIEMRPDEAMRLLTHKDYYKFVASREFRELPEEFRKACLPQLCEKMCRNFFWRWALEPFLEFFTHRRLPILCCEQIMKNLTNEDLHTIFDVVHIYENDDNIEDI